MIRPRVVPLLPLVWGVLIGLAWVHVRVGPTRAEPAPAVLETNPGQFFPITEPITNEVIDQLRAATKQLIDRSRRRAGGAADPGLRVPAGRGLAGAERVRRVASTWPT